MSKPIFEIKPWVGVLFFALGSGLVVGVLVASLQPNGFAQGFIMGFIGGLLIADGLAIIVGTSGGSP